MADSASSRSSCGVCPFSADMNEKPRFLLLYGSETGNAEAITADLVDQAAERGLFADRYELNETDRRFNIERERCVVIVTSTTGEGDPPTNAVKFMRRITKRTLPNDYLNLVNITLLGLGDSNYSNFCNCGKTLWTTLMNLGAMEFYPPGWADDATGLEEVVDPWMDGLWEPLVDTLKKIATESDSKTNGPVSNGIAIENVSVHYEDHVDSEDAKDKEIDPESCECDMCISQALAGQDLTIPLLGPSFLKILYDESSCDTSGIPVLNGSHLPSSASNVIEVPVSKASKLSSDDALKRTLEIELDISDTEFEYEPGDSFSIVCQNDPTEVECLLRRLDLTEVADKQYALSIDPETKKRAPSVPKHIPSQTTLRYTLTHCCDLRAVPKKAVLRALVETIGSETEKRRLQELCSKEGQSEYSKYIRNPSLGLLDILDHFKSCKPSIERLLEFLQPLQPRPYSASTSNLATPGKLGFVFNVIEIDKNDGRTYSRQGICTGWLNSLTLPEGLDGKLSNLSLQSLRLPIFMRTHNSFHLPADPSIPVIMIGPGTGVAPFIGFLKHRQKLAENEDFVQGKMWLFFGCRHRSRDYLYESEIQEFVKCGTLERFNVSFSREESQDQPKYVQDSMQIEKETLIEWLDSDANIYVCGDAKNMAKDVFEKFVVLYGEVKGVSEKDARSFMMTKRLKKTYHEDVWT